MTFGGVSGKPVILHHRCSPGGSPTAGHHKTLSGLASTLHTKGEEGRRFAPEIFLGELMIGDYRGRPA
jgi:hypothetical protein